jgi:hypothetical protein
MDEERVADGEEKSEEETDDDDDEDDDDDDDDEDDEREGRGLISMLKPVFVSRDDRETRDKRLVSYYKKFLNFLIFPMQ